MQRQIDALREQNDRQTQEIAAMKRASGEAWLTDERAAQVRGIVADVLADAQTRASLQGDGATAGRDRNFFIASADGNFRLNIEAEMQVRYAFNNMPNASLAGASSDRKQVANEYGFEIRRAKMNFFGHVFDPSWSYRIELGYERDGAQSGKPLSFEDVFVQKALGEGLFLRLGQWKTFFNYETVASSRTQQFVERSLVNQYFSQSFVQGVLLGWESKQFRAFASYNDGGGNRDVAIIQPTGNLTEWATTARIEWMPVGAWGQFKDMQGWRGSDFAAMVGAGVNWQRAGGVPPSGRLTVSNGLLRPASPGLTQVNDQVTLLTFTADANLRGDGWSGWAAFLGNYLYGGGARARAVGVEGTLSYGAVVQGGYFVSDALELIARYEGLWVISDQDSITGASTALVNQTLNIVTLGASWYFHKNAIKFTLDGGYSFEPVIFSTGLFGEGVSGASWRASQTGTGGGETVVRAQMQLLF